MRTKLDPRFDQPGKNLCRTMEDVGHVLRLRRKELGYSQTELATLAGCSQRLISEIERGRPTVATETILKLAMGLGIDTFLCVRGKE